MVVKASDGARLAICDAVPLLKDLKMKATSVTLRRGTVIRDIRSIEDAAEIECIAE